MNAVDQNGARDPSASGLLDYVLMQEGTVLENYSIYLRPCSHQSPHVYISNLGVGWGGGGEREASTNFKKINKNILIVFLSLV